MLRILSESGHERNRNAGDEAYFEAMVGLFRKYLPAVEITTFSDRPHHDRDRYNVRTVYSGGSLKRSVKSIGTIINEIKRCDIYLWGAGQILRDDNFIFSPPYRLSRPFLAAIMGKPVMAYGIGIGPLDTKVIRLLARFVLSRFSLISYRDETTGQILDSLKLRGHLIQKTVDPAFGLIPADKGAVDNLLAQLNLEPEAGPLVGVAPFGPAFRGKFSGIRNLLPAKFQADRDMWQEGGKEQYNGHIELLARFYDHIIETRDAKLVFVIQDASGQGLDDRICRDIVSSLTHQESAVIFNADDYTPALVKGLMGRMEIVTGGRMHSLILASGIATPVMAICYESKIKALAKVIDQPDCFIDGYALRNESELIGLFDRIWNSRDIIKGQLENRNRELWSEVCRNVSRLKDLVMKNSAK